MSNVHKPWEAEHAVSVEQARALIAVHLPALAKFEVTHAGRGWDVEVMRAGPFAVRFPRRAVAIPLVEAEIRVLPRLGPRLPISIPLPLHTAPASADFPAPFYAHPWLEGTTADRARLGEAARFALAGPLGRFLRALHSVGDEEARGLGLLPPSLRLSMAERGERARSRLEEMCNHLVAYVPEREEVAGSERAPVDRALVARVIDALAPEGDLYESVRSAPAPRASAIHGDLYARHLLLDERSGLAAVIDWGDVALGDPAEDLALAWSFLPASARAAFFAAYGPVDAGERAKARFSALSRYAGSLLAYACDVGDAPLVEEAQAAARFALEE